MIESGSSSDSADVRISTLRTRDIVENPTKGGFPKTEENWKYLQLFEKWLKITLAISICSSVGRLSIIRIEYMSRAAQNPALVSLRHPTARTLNKSNFAWSWDEKRNLIYSKIILLWFIHKQSRHFRRK